MRTSSTHRIARSVRAQQLLQQGAQSSPVCRARAHELGHIRAGPGLCPPSKQRQRGCTYIEVLNGER